MHLLQQTTLSSRQQAVNFFKQALMLSEEDIQPYPLDDKLIAEQGALWGYGLSLQKPGSKQPEAVFWLFKRPDRINGYALVYHT